MSVKHQSKIRQIPNTIPFVLKKPARRSKQLQRRSIVKEIDLEVLNIESKKKSYKKAT